MAFHWFVLDVALISFAILAASRIALATISQALAEAGADQTASEVVEQSEQSLLYRRIAKDDPGPILRIEAMDHFVAVITPQATHQLRLRFADAVEQMAGVQGMMTHRSHWVARDAVIGVQHMQGRVFVRMTDGALVPVSRKYRAAVDAAGLRPVSDAA